MHALERLQRCQEHVAAVASQCPTAATRQQALVLPFLRALGFPPEQPAVVNPHYVGDGANVDYAVSHHDAVAMLFILVDNATAVPAEVTSRLQRAFSATPTARVGWITDGLHWFAYTDLTVPGTLDDDPFLAVHLPSAATEELTRLLPFCAEHFQREPLAMLGNADALRQQVAVVFENDLQNPSDALLQYFMARCSWGFPSAAGVLDALRPIVRQAMSEAFVDVVRKHFLGQPPLLPNHEETDTPSELIAAGDPVDLPDQLLRAAQCILGPGAELSINRTASYAALLYGNRVNRWLARYYWEGRNPRIQWCIPVSEADLPEGLLALGSDGSTLDRPEALIEGPTILQAAFAFCCNDDNFRRKTV